MIDAVALGQAAAVGGDGQRNVAEARERPAQGPVEQDLTGRAGDQIVAADHLVHAHQGVVHDHGKLVRRPQSVPGDEEVAAQPGGIQLDAAKEQVVPGDRPSRHPEPPGERPIAQGRRHRPHGDGHRFPGYVGPSSSACGALAARSISARVQVHG